MRVLSRVAATLLIAFPLLLVLVVIFALAPKRRASLSLEVLSPRDRGGPRGVPFVLRNATPGDHYPGRC